MIVAAVQTLASHDIGADIDRCRRALGAAADSGAELLLLPEICVGLDQRGQRPRTLPFAEDEHPAIPAFADLARRRRVWLLAGSLGILAGDADGRCRNRSLLFGPDGQITARYDKIHLFDAAIDSANTYRESARIAPGERAVLAALERGGERWQLGLSICYDLRFAALYRALARAGAELLCVPAAFTRPTGRAHWEPLLRARAIETGCYLIAAGQHPPPGAGRDRGCHGHSLIIDPWGKVLARCAEGPGHALARIERAAVARARARVPALANARDFHPPAPL